MKQTRRASSSRTPTATCPPRSISRMTPVAGPPGKLLTQRRGASPPTSPSCPGRTEAAPGRAIAQGARRRSNFGHPPARSHLVRARFSSSARGRAALPLFVGGRTNALAIFLLHHDRRSWTFFRRGSGRECDPFCRPTQIFGLHLPLWIRHNRLCYRSGMRDRRRTLRTFLPSTIRLVAPHSLSAIHDRLRQIRRVREDEASLLQDAVAKRAPHCLFSRIVFFAASTPRLWVQHRCRRSAGRSEGDRAGRPASPSSSAT